MAHHTLLFKLQYVLVNSVILVGLPIRHLVEAVDEAIVYVVSLKLCEFFIN